MPAYIGVLTDESSFLDQHGSDGDKTQQIQLMRWIATVLRSLAFVAGISTTFIALGFGAGSFGRFFAQSSDLLGLIGGGIVVLMGLHQMELIRLTFLEGSYTIRRRKKSSMNAQKGTENGVLQKRFAIRNQARKLIKAYILGITLSFGWTPCVGPVLGAVLVATATQGTQLVGASMIAFYALGLSLPFVILALASGVLLQWLPAVEKHLTRIKKIGGAIVVVMGLLLMTGQLTVITIWLNRFTQ